jgi:hypothetical protein
LVGRRPPAKHNKKKRSRGTNVAKILIIPDAADKLTRAADYSATHVFEAHFDEKGQLIVKCVKNAFQPARQGEEADGEGAALLLGASLVHSMQVELLEKQKT